MKILVVDDSRMARKMMIKTLREHLDGSEEILDAQNGEEALVIYQEQEPALVFLDLTMPVMDGFTALEKIKEINEHARVVVVSADIQKGSMDRVREAGAFDFVKKPITNEKMQNIFDKLKMI